MDAPTLESLVHGLARALDDARARDVGTLELTLADVIVGRGGQAARVPKLAEAQPSGARREVSADIEVLRRVTTEATEGTTFAPEVARWCALEKTYETAEHAAFALSRMLHDAQARERILERREQFMRETTTDRGPHRDSDGPSMCLSMGKLPERDGPGRRARISPLLTIGVMILFIVVAATVVHWLFD